MNQALTKALTYIENNQIEEAITELKHQAIVSDDETKYDIAELYYQLGLVDLAKELIEQLLHLYPNDGELVTFLAELLIDVDQEEEAINILLNVKDDDPVYSQAQLLLADLYQLQGLDEVAEQKLLNALSKAPKEPVIQFGLGEFYLSRGDYTKSIPYYKRVLPFQQSLPGTNISLRLAEAFSGSGYFEDALFYYEKGIGDNSTIDDYFGYGFTAFQLKKYKVAIQQFEYIIFTDESYTTVYAYLAEAYEEEGLHKEALETINKGLKLDEYNDSLYILAGTISLNSGNVEEGEGYLRKALALNPSNYEAVNVLAHFLKQNERYDELEELIMYLKDLGEEDPLFDWFLATAKRHLEEFDEALAIFSEIKKALDHDSDFLEEYADTLLESGYSLEAKKLYMQLLKLDPSKDYIKETVLQLEEYES